MGWIMLSKPGTEYGPCKGKCKHKDCAATREEAACLCQFCDKPIGYESKFYCDRAEGVVGKPHVWSHFVCAHKDADKKRVEANAAHALRLCGL